MPTNVFHNFHLPLSHELYQRLKIEANTTRKPVTALVRQAISFWLKQRKRASLHKTIASYAATHAGTPVDLDEDLEKAAIEHLLSDGELA